MMSEEELEILRYVDCSSSEIETVNKAVDTIEKLQKENKQLKERIQKAIKKIKLLGKFDGEKCTKGFNLMSADFNELLDILQGKEDK